MMAQCRLPYWLENTFTQALSSKYTISDVRDHEATLVESSERINNLKQVLNCSGYRKQLSLLLRNPDITKRSCGYMLLYNSNDTNWKIFLSQQLNIDTARFTSFWLIGALISTQPNGLSEALFNRVAECNDHDRNLLSSQYLLHISIDTQRIVFNRHLTDPRISASSFSLLGLARLGFNREVDSMARIFVSSWNGTDKWDAIYALGLMRSGNLNKLLLPYYNEESLQNVIIGTLLDSSTKEDRDIGEKLDIEWIAKYRE